MKKSLKKIGSKRRKTSRSLRLGLTEWHDANDFETCLMKFTKVTMKFILKLRMDGHEFMGTSKGGHFNVELKLTKTGGDDPKANWSSRSDSSVAEDSSEEKIEASSGWM